MLCFVLAFHGAASQPPTFLWECLSCSCKEFPELCLKLSSTTTGILQLDSLDLSMAGMQYTIAVTSTNFIGASSMLTSVTIFSRSWCQFPWYHSAAYRCILLIKRDDQVQGCLLIMSRFWGSWTVLWMEPGSSSWKNWQRSASGILGQRHPLSLHSWWNLADQIVHFQHQGDTCLSATVDSSVSGWAFQNQSLHVGWIHGGPTKYYHVCAQRRGIIKFG